MKGTAMVVAVGGTVTAASAACKFEVPFSAIQPATSMGGMFHSARLESFSCDLSESCCHGVQHAEWDDLTARGYPDYAAGSIRATMDLSGTCSRADQVDLYKCAVDNMPKLVPQGKEGKMRALIQSKGCPNVAANLAQSHEVNQCSLNLGKGKGMKIGALSDSCCGALNNVVHAKGAGKHAAGCGLIGVCGEKDQMTLLKFAEGKGMCKGQGPWCQQSELELLETFNRTNAGAPQMMATFMTSMTSEAENDAIEDPGTVTVASAACKFEVPFKFIQNGAPIESFRCDLSGSCCHGVQHAEWDDLTARGYPDYAAGSIRATMDLSGTCSRADQVDLYKCAVDTLPKLVPQGKEGMMRAMIQSKGCANVAANLAQSHEVNQCSLNLGKGKGMKIGALSDSCCGALNNVVHAKGAGKHAAGCGLIGVCGEKDQMTVLKFAKGKGMCKGQGPWCQQSELELLETFNMTNAGATQMMATFMTSMTSEAEDDVIEDDVIEDDDSEDDVTEDGSPIGAGILGFVAGAAVTGLGVAALRRRAPSSQNEYNEIVA